MRDDLFKLARTTLVLVALYLVLVYAGGAIGIVRATGSAWASILRVLQGPQPARFAGGSPGR